MVFDRGICVAAGGRTSSVGPGCVEACSAVSAVGNRVIPPSSLSNHFKVLREAGVIRSERHGVEMRNHSRWREVEARFPGLLAALINAYAAEGGPSLTGA
ncbi:hypothetical protein ASG60_19415 [Methylobacterium sp. Leaf469]|nr:hypothetical protein ASG60_19415 [Methylobacterium sp. Leaf469]